MISSVTYEPSGFLSDTELPEAVYFDNRWMGQHGIGRFALEINERLKLIPMNIRGNTTSPLDPLFFWLSIVRLPKKRLVWSPGYNAPIFVRKPFVFSIHDLNHIDIKENSSVFKRTYYKIVIRRACKRASRIITVSEYSRRNIISWAKVPPSKVVNVGNGVGSAYCNSGAKTNLGFPYLLCVGNRKRHKNERRVIEAFIKARIAAEIRLCFTGFPSRELHEVCTKNGIIDRVIFLGEINEEDMPALYRGAMALIFPSLYEGFGLPVIESMACGTPVLTSNVTSLPEVAGHAALMVPPMEVEQIANGIEKLTGDETTRALLIERGLVRAEMYNWDDVAERVKNVFLEAMSTTGTG